MTTQVQEKRKDARGPAHSKADHRGGGRMTEILESAAQLFYEKGFHGTSIEDVAGEVGMLKGSLYYYIESKEDLLYQLLLEDIRRATGVFDDNTAGTAAPLEKLKRTLGAHIEYIINNRIHVGVFLRESGMLEGKRRHRVAELIRGLRGKYADLVKQCQAEGNIVQHDPWILANSLLGMANWVHRWYDESSGHSPAQIREALLDVMLRGIIRT